MKQDKSILITDELHPLLKEGLEHDGFTVDARPDISADEVLKIIHEYEGLVINSKVYVGRELLERAAKLKFVCRAGSGLDTIDLNCARQKNILVFNSPEGNRNAVAEHALGMLLNIMNNISRAYEQVKNKEWVREKNRGNELRGKTIGLLAFGNTAQAFAKLLIGFDVNILAYDKYVTGFTNDFVTEATEYMVDYKFLSSFKKPIWLINTSRGKVLRTEDLSRCLKERKIIAAALDVLENENLNSFNEKEKKVFDELLASNRILITPHIAGWTHESKRKIAEVLLEKIKMLY